MDYKQLYQRLHEEILARENISAANAEKFIDDFIKKLKSENWQLSDDTRADLSLYFDSLKAQVAASITAANTLVLGSAMAAPEILRLTELAFSRRWQDGKTLSDRLWVLNDRLEKGLKETLQAGIAQGQSANSIIYDIQRSFERDGRAKFLENYVDSEDWAADLFASGRQTIKNPKMRKQWEKTVAETRKVIQKLKRSGTRNAAERAFSQMLKAVEEGNAELLSDALKWWGYDKQLYYIKRIVRTEMANAAHNAVIDSTFDDDLIIGYQWRLSGSHPADSVCICAKYADIEMGLGRGVWAKDKVPRIKPHPHCMCLIVPRTTKVKAKGGQNYEDLPKAKT